MTRFLFVVPPLTGHINPLIGVARELERQGHEIHWLGHVKAVLPLLPEGAHFHAFDRARARDLLEPLSKRAAEVRGLESVRFLFEEFVSPLAKVTLPEVERAIEVLSPDMIVTDQQMLSGALAARRKRIPWVATVTTTAAIFKVWDIADRWITKVLADMQRACGMEVWPRPDLSPLANLVFSTPEFSGRFDQFHAPFTFVGPSLASRPQKEDFPWDRLSPSGPRLLITLGTVNRDRDPRFYQVVIEALAELSCQVILVAPEAWLDRTPANFITAPRVPQLALLPHVDAVFCHAGHNTVCEALAHGLPLIVAPIRDDQPVIARQVTRAGAGVGLRFGRLTETNVRTAVETVLEDATYREAAQHIGTSFARAGGSPLAARTLIEVASRYGTVAGGV